MAIDARITGFNIAGLDTTLTLEPRGKCSVAGQSLLLIESPFEESDHIGDLVGCEVWGNANQLMLGDAKLADRIGYTQIRLVPWWRELVKAYK